MRDTRHESRTPEVVEAGRSSDNAGGKDGGEWPADFRLPALTDEERAAAIKEDRARGDSERDEGPRDSNPESTDRGPPDSGQEGDGQNDSWPEDARLPELDPDEKDQVRRNIRDTF